MIKHLSKGYRQRVGLAQAIVGYPEVIILDEPTVGLDPMQIIEIRDLVKELAEKHTVIISSHILSEISAVCDTVMIINKGKMVVTDTVKNLPKHLKGATNLELEVKATEKEVRTALSSIDEIFDAQYTKGSEDGFTQINIDVTGKRELREEIFFALAKAKHPIYQMSMNTLSLEDIFLEMTKQAYSESEEIKSEDETQEPGIIQTGETALELEKQTNVETDSSV